MQPVGHRFRVLDDSGSLALVDLGPVLRITTGAHNVRSSL
ncbi:hypothetical protein CLV92_113122 [Kineococcus xinjiangensis]|uniref:Uncharacterized protein n=1 Tax=Kineococcus xinjiangensis TaxID=512762 RepID=A0A2S6IER9_9ACTN|nr:hypothetical protein CLV92_113122 [Kineococcus xinjiangensis]